MVTRKSESSSVGSYRTPLTSVNERERRELCDAATSVISRRDDWGQSVTALAMSKHKARRMVLGDNGASGVPGVLLGSELLGKFVPEELGDIASQNLITICTEMDLIAAE